MLELTATGMGVRSQRYLALEVDGVVKTLDVGAPGRFEASDAGTILGRARAAKA